MKRHSNQLLVLVALAAIFLFSFAPHDAEASHFRGGHLTWSKVPDLDPNNPSNKVNIKFTHFWRTSPSSGRILDANGSQVTSIPIGTMIASGTDLSGEVWQKWENNLTVTLTGPAPHTLEMFPSCCRIGQLVNAPNDYWRIQTIIDLPSGQTGSTVSSLPPILQVAKGLNTISIPVADPDSNNITCRLSTAQESSIGCTPGLTQSGSSCFGGPAAIVTNNCFIIWDASNQADKAKHAIQIALEEGGLRTSLDIIMEVSGGLVNNDPPTCTLDNNAPVNNTGAVGQLFSISATGTDPEESNLRINHQGIPSGSTLSPANGTTTSSPATATWSYTPSAPGETHAVTLTFTDDGNQTCQTSFTLSVPDNQPPEADAGVDQIIEQTGPGAMSVILNGSGSSDPDGDPLTYAWSGDATATGVNPTVLLGAGTHDITLTVSDGSASDSDSVQVIVQDTIAPVISVSDRTEEATGPSQSVDVSGDASATDAVGVASLSNNSPGTFNANTTTVVTWTACDAAGNCSTADQNVTIQDTIAPVISVSDRTEEATGPSQSVNVSGDASATDAVGVASLSNNSPGTFNANTTTVVTWTACDAAGNCSTADQNVTIQDTIAPVISVSDRTEEATAVNTPVDVSDDASASDAVGVASLTNDSPGTFTVGSHTVTWTACDAAVPAPNCSTATQTVTITDNTPPDISNACLTGKLWPPNHRMVLVSTGSVTDLGDANPATSISVTSNQPINGTGDGNTEPDWIANTSGSDYDVSLRAERAGNLGQRDYGIVITATDASGNTSTAACSASVPHDQGKNNSPATKKGKK